METIPDGGDKKNYFDAEVEVLTSILKKSEYCYIIYVSLLKDTLHACKLRDLRICAMGATRQCCNFRPTIVMLDPSDHFS
jgi:hypothetical protein